MSNTKENIRYFIVNAESKEGYEEICLQCVASPTEEGLLLFLNNIYSASRYLAINNFHEVLRNEAESKGLDRELFYAEKYFELGCTAPDGTEMKFCITGIKEPDYQDALKSINSGLKDAEKMKSINWVKAVDMAEAIQHYDMEHWTRPWDLILTIGKIYQIKYAVFYLNLRVMGFEYVGMKLLLYCIATKFALGCKFCYKRLFCILANLNAREYK